MYLQFETQFEVHYEKHKRNYLSYSRDETLEALGDANTVAPATRTADLHSQSHRNSYLYVFDYQTKFGDYPQVCDEPWRMRFI